MRLTFHEEAWEDYLYWQSSDRKQLKKINALLRECLRTPFAGTGKPEPLKGEFAGWWSRRIDQEHRLVYRATGDSLLIAQCRYHYSR
ncbi:Txe/YoeB family addiction module toxin [Brevundimonas bullata]|uniref:Txe/YoeB family addiction module toxin n=1 Tax=Brevundimonas bullata TaxID=13160 RepID=UPI000E09E590|nr:Txe/YoeB family addiction module toxin [Brevundimonas bullata]WQE37104.1 Txe/YoeB family addiction module toxin [Brevundimonas bullata]